MVARHAQRWLLLVVALGLLPGCSPAIRIHTHIQLPPGVQANVSSLKVLLAAAPTRAEQAPMVPVAEHPNLIDFQVVPQEGGFEARITLRMSQAFVRMTAWLDTNGNGVRDESELQGALAPAPVRVADPGAFSCGTNLARTQRIILRPAAP